MRRSSYLLATVLGILTSVPVLVLTYVGAELARLPLVAFDFFDLLVSVLPGSLLTLAIDAMVAILNRLDPGAVSDRAKRAEHILALVLFLLLGAVVGIILEMLGRRRDRGRLPLLGLAAGSVLLAIAIVTESVLGFPAAGPVRSVLWLSALFLTWGWALGWLLRGLLPAPSEPVGWGFSRRQFLHLVGATAVALAAAAGLGFMLCRRTAGQRDPASPPVGADTSGAAASPPEEVLADRIAPAPGTRPEVTTNADFFHVSIRSLAPQIDVAAWRLQVGGLVERPLSLTLEEIRARPAVSQYVTLACISNPIGGSLLGTALYKGVRLKDLLEEAGFHPQAVQVFIESTDGFYEGVGISAATDERTLLVYEMNGEPLRAEHGFPLRLYVANRYGMKLPKWIVHLEVVDTEREGYWVKRGWSRRAVPQALSNIDHDTLSQMDAEAQSLSLGGIAYAGDRGISRVEVQVDDGPWAEAELRVPPLSPLTWVQWRYDWPARPGRHIARVRAYERDGHPQKTADSAPHPDGATGIHSVRFEV